MKWAAPIFPVLKSNDTIQTITVNQVSFLEKHLLPGIFYLNTRLSNLICLMNYNRCYIRKAVTRLYMAHTYQLLLIHEEWKNILSSVLMKVCFNKIDFCLEYHKHLFYSNAIWNTIKLLFRVSSPPSIFQHIKDNLLHCLRHVTSDWHHGK